MIWAAIIPVGIILAAIAGGFFMAFYAAALINDPGDRPREYGKSTPVEIVKQISSDSTDADLDHGPAMSQDLHALAVHILGPQTDPQPSDHCDADQSLRSLR